MTITVLLGGARSGKSSLAVDLGRRHGSVTFVATAPIVDEDMATRRRDHRRERPASWTTVEEETDLAECIRDAAPDAMVIVDCLTLWTSNMLWRERSADDIDAAVDDSIAAARTRSGPVVVISNEVGLGLHPETELGRRYRDIHGRVNRRWAAAADHPLLVVAGRALPLVDPWSLLPKPDGTEPR